MFFDFSSAFNKMQPLLFGDELWAMQVDTPLVSWIMDFLSGRPRFVRLHVRKRSKQHRCPPGGCPLPLPVYSLQFRLQEQLWVWALWTNCLESGFHKKGAPSLNVASTSAKCRKILGNNKNKQTKSYHFLLALNIEYVHFLDIYCKHSTLQRLVWSL